jgi:hypothetical protein
MSVSRSSTPSFLTRVRSHLPTFFQASTSPAPDRPHHAAGFAPAMGHGSKNNLIGAGWNGAAMLFGTLAWMGVYYAKDLFAEIDEDGAASYVLHSLAMGVVANLAVYPFVLFNHLARGEARAQANAEFRKYFILCTIPDALYEPTADWLAAMATSDSFTNYDFKKYAQPTFNTKEVAGAFGFFFAVYGMIYYFGDNLIQRLAPDESTEPAEAALAVGTTYSQRFLRSSRHVLVSDEGVAILAALQYFIFYLTDDLFEVDWVTFEETAPQVLGMAGLMAAYTFVADALPVLLQHLENKMYPQAAAVSVPNAETASLTQSLLNGSEEKEELSPALERNRLWYFDSTNGARASDSQKVVVSEARYQPV